MAVILLEKMSHLGKIHHLKAQSVGAFGNEAEKTSFIYIPNQFKGVKVVGSLLLKTVQIISDTCQTIGTYA